MRGAHKLSTLTASLFPDLAAPAEPSNEEKLYEAKRRAIAARYYHYISKGTLTSEAVLKTLEEEFYISSRRLADIIAEEAGYIRQLRHDKPKKDWFRTTFAHFVW